MARTKHTAKAVSSGAQSKASKPGRRKQGQPRKTATKVGYAPHPDEQPDDSDGLRHSGRVNRQGGRPNYSALAKGEADAEFFKSPATPAKKPSRAPDPAAKEAAARDSKQAQAAPKQQQTPRKTAPAVSAHAPPQRKETRASAQQKRSRTEEPAKTATQDKVRRRSCVR
jgi:hypothetical protein